MSAHDQASHEPQGAHGSHAHPHLFGRAQPHPDRTDGGTRVTGTALVVVASNRAAAGAYDDATGPVIADWLTALGWRTTVDVVPDGAPVGEALRAGIAAGAGIIVTTGGTGASPTDRTPEQTRAVLDFELPGIAEEMRRVGSDTTPTALLSRGIAGVAGSTLVVNLPGSSGGVRDGLAVLGTVLDHLLDQIHGGDHVRAD